MYTLRASRPEDGAALVDLWRRSVDATHHFLSPDDRKAIDAEVVEFLPHAPVTVAVDEHDQPRSEEHTSELQSQSNLVCRLLLEKKKKNAIALPHTLQQLRYKT